MASKRPLIPAKHLSNAFFHQTHRTSQIRLQRSRTMATTEAPLPRTALSQTPINADIASTTPTSSNPQTHQPPRNPFLTTTTITLHTFPSLTPLSFHPYPSTHLLVPLRKDLLHRAIIYEADNTRQGTASTKHRSEIHGSGAKIRPQKGSGAARLGDKKSPMLRGGGVAFGPKPRDFGTGLPAKVYDVAWRMAISYRYRLGELLVLADEAEIPAHIHPASRERWLRDMLRWNHMGHPDRRTLFITTRRREALFQQLLEQNGKEARALEVGEVDVKDLLEGGRVVVERWALEELFRRHERDLAQGLRLEVWKGERGLGGPRRPAGGGGMGIRQEAGAGLMVE